jgi:demethylmenaquinone methyltransferase / 2-methoxy-6-polyprenyl-1,4-benzoquinol methylase
MNPAPVDVRETLREQQFSTVWTNDLNRVFANIAPYYDIANYVASFGLWGWFRHRFMKTVEAHPYERVLDVCAGTNAIGIALLKREPTLEVHAIDRSAEMQDIGQKNAQSLGFKIHSVIGDVHTLPFPDHHFDVVTLQFASRHLRVRQVFKEIHRVLKVGGRFYHCDMLRPNSRIVGAVYYVYLRFVLWLTAFLFRTGEVALNCKQYFVNSLQAFYTVQELSDMLLELGYTNVTDKALFNGTLGFHKAIKPSKD